MILKGEAIVCWSSHFTRFSSRPQITRRQETIRGSAFPSRFEVHGIAPGDYKLFSWEEIETSAWEDPEFLKLFEEKGEKISLKDGDQKTLNLTAIRTRDAESHLNLSSSAVVAFRMSRHSCS